jgi:hypothetical protein
MTRANSCSAIGATAIGSRSPTSRVATSRSVKRSRPQKSGSPSPSSIVRSRSSAGALRCVCHPLQSPAAAPGLGEDLTYPFHDVTIAVTHCGRICFKGRKVNLSRALAGQNIGVTQVGDRLWLVTFMQYDLGYFDDETCRLEPIENPFGAKCYLCRRNKPSPIARRASARHRAVARLNRPRAEADGSSGWIRTSNPPVNSRMLCR